MRDQLRVSVVITSYNQREYLREAIDSVLAQTVPAHEIIVADDESHDGSPELIRDYEARYPGRVKGVFQAKNVGLPRNRNAALPHVTGTHVAILDGDDAFVPWKIAREAEALARHPDARVSYGNLYRCDADLQPYRIRDQELRPSGDVFLYVAKGRFGLLRCMLVEWETFRRVGFMDERFENFDGYDLTVRLAKVSPFAYCLEPLVKKREHPACRSKHIRPSVHEQRMRDLFEKMQPLLADLPAADRQAVVRSWRQRIDYAGRRRVVREGRRLELIGRELWARVRGYR